MSKKVSEKWMHNDFTDVLGEYGEDAGAFLALYAEAFGLVTGRRIPESMYEASVARDEEVYVMRPELVELFRPRPTDLLRFWLWTVKNSQDKRPVSLMVHSIFLSLLYQYVPTKSIFTRREGLTLEIRSALKESPKHFDITTVKQQSERKEIVIVQGEALKAGPFYDMQGSDDAIPDDVVVRCEQLHPALKDALPRIKGIICYNGSQLSHVAICAREMQLPMKIHARQHAKK